VGKKFFLNTFCHEENIFFTFSITFFRFDDWRVITGLACGGSGLLLLCIVILILVLTRKHVETPKPQQEDPPQVAPPPEAPLAEIEMDFIDNGHIYEEIH